MHLPKSLLGNIDGMLSRAHDSSFNTCKRIILDIHTRTTLPSPTKLSPPTAHTIQVYFSRGLFGIFRHPATDVILKRDPRNSCLPFQRHRDLNIPFPHTRVPFKSPYPVTAQSRPPKLVLYPLNGTASMPITLRRTREGL